MSFMQIIIKGGDRFSNIIDVLHADLGLLSLLRMGEVPRPNTLADRPGGSDGGMFIGWRSMKCGW